MPETAEPTTEIRQKAMPGKTLSVDLAARTVRHLISTPDLDEDGEVLLPRGADLSRFKGSPTVFINHQYGAKDVLGSCVGLEQTDTGIVATTKIASRPPTLPADQEWLPDTILHYLNEGHIRGWSVGFATNEVRLPSKKDVADYGDRIQRVITRWKMLEYSVAPLQCNGGAVTLSYQKGLISKELHDGLVAGKALKDAVKLHKYASTQINLSGPIVDAMTAIRDLISADDLAPDGFETEPHVTVKYGLLADGPEAVRDAVAKAGIGPVTLTFGKTSLFTNDEHDVVKLDVAGDALRKLNATLSELPNEDSRPDYIPHATIAYVKKGAGQKYEGLMGAANLTHVAGSLVFSGRDRTTTEIPLTAAAAKSLPPETATPQPAAKAESTASAPVELINLTPSPAEGASVPIEEIILLPRSAHSKTLADAAHKAVQRARGVLYT